MSSKKKETKEFSRRKFLKTGALAGGAAIAGLTMGLPGLANLTKSPKLMQQLGLSPVPIVRASYFVPQTALDGTTIPKYVDPVPTFVGARVNAFKYRNLTVNNVEFQENLLPASIYSGLGSPYSGGTYVWGYSVNNGVTTAGPFYPAFTIEARQHIPVRVTYVNSLTNTFLQRYLSVDQTIHWANPLNAMDQLEPYTGPVPVVTHLHGGEVPSASDGGPDSWFTPGYSYRGPAWNYGGVTQYYEYPNEQEATTLFYHDHVLGATRLNLYAGLVGFYFIRDEFDTGIPGKGLNLPAGPYEIELAIQDKQFDTNGQLLFPDGTETPIGFNGPPPNPDIHPFWNPEFFGDVIVVNGKSWPFLNVEPRRYRFRIVDGANARFFNLTIPGSQIWVIGTDGGLLDKPIAVPTLLLGPGERADIIVDFAPTAGTSIVMTNDALAPFPDGGGDPPNFADTVGQVMKFNVGTTVTGGTDKSFNPAAPGARLRGIGNNPPAIVRLADGVGGIASGVKIDKYRMLTLVEVAGPGGPIEVLLNNTRWPGLRDDNSPLPGSVQLGPNWLTELPKIGATEQWDIINTTGDAHPIHVHLVQFQLMNRQNFDLRVDANDVALPGGYRFLYNSLFPGGDYIPRYGPPQDYFTPNQASALGGNPDVTPFLLGAPEPPKPWEVGWKDTFRMMPGQVTRVIIRWAPQDTNINAAKPGKNSYKFDASSGPGYVWHCHIVDHEDNEMMRPYKPVK